MKPAIFMIMAATALTLLAAPLIAVAAPGKSHDKWAQRYEEHNDKRTDAIVNRVFSNLERALIAEYFGEQWKIAERTGHLPPGLAKRGSLPPGLQKQLIRNGKLPPGLDKRDLPNDLLKRLGATPQGTQRYIVGTDIILVDIATNLLLDTIKGALYPPRSDIKWRD